MTAAAITQHEAGRRLVLAVVLPSASFPMVLASLTNQTSGSWEAIVVGGHETSHGITTVPDTGTFADSVNVALSGVRADYVMIARNDGSLRSTAVSDLAELAAHLPADLVYADEAVLDGRLVERIARPHYSPERLRSQYSLGNAVFYRTDFLRSLGGLRAAACGVELHDLALRASRRSPVVKHFTRPLFKLPNLSTEHTELSPVQVAAAEAVLTEHMRETGGGVVESVSSTGTHRTRRAVNGSPLVSIIIPTRGVAEVIDGTRTSLVLNAVRTVVEKSTYRNYEIVIVVDAAAEQDVLDDLHTLAGNRLQIVRWNRPFNFSGKMNLGVFASRGEFVLFLNDDTEVISPGWIEALLALCQRPGAGMSGAMLYFDDDTVQHAGHLYVGGGAGHIGTNDPRGSRGFGDAYLVEREVAGVTAACSMMPRAVFDQVGGFSLLLPGNFNDVDLCMKTTNAGYTIYWTPYAELYHFESKTRVARVTEYELRTIRGRWNRELHDTGFWPHEHWQVMKEGTR